MYQIVTFALHENPKEVSIVAADTDVLYIFVSLKVNAS